MDEVHKPEKYTIDDLKRIARRGLIEAIEEAKAGLVTKLSKIEGFSYDNVYRCVTDLECVIFEVPEHQFGQDMDVSESVLERLRREFGDLFKAPLEEVAGKVGMLGNLVFHGPNNKKFPEIGGLVVNRYSGEEILAVHFELLSGRVGREARFVYSNQRPTEYKSISDAFKELVEILEEQGQMIPKI